MATHAAQWECEWITKNSHRYQNPSSDIDIKRNIITRHAFQKGLLLRDASQFRTTPGLVWSSVGEPSTPVGQVKVTKRLNITDVGADIDGVGFIQLMFPHASENFTQVVERYAILADKYTNIKDLLEAYAIQKEYSINSAVLEVVEKEVSDGAVFFMSQGSWGMIASAVFEINDVAAVYQFTLE